MAEDGALKILFVASEAAPLAKTGGLGDVIGALPDALRGMGVDVRLVLPFYAAVREGGFQAATVISELPVPVGDTRYPARILETQSPDGVPVYLVDQPRLYDRTGLYGEGSNDYADNLERFSCLSHAALGIAAAVGFVPHVVHCHDWQTGLIPALLKGPYAADSAWAGTSTVFTVHNLGYPGVFPAQKLPLTGLPRHFFRVGGVEYWGNISLLKAGIVYADALTAVSPSYAREILTPEYGMGLDGLLRQRKDVLHGILNGVDYRVWDPALDHRIAAKFSDANMAGKTACKQALIAEFGLDPDMAHKPLVGMTARLDGQKGVDLMLAALDGLIDLDMGFVFLGTGYEHIQKALQAAAVRHAGRIGVRIGFNDELAHRIVAGSDMFLVPSRYEPCGLTQMYALKYGTVPIVRATGGLNDTVEQFDGSRGTGFKIEAHTPEALLARVGDAVDLWRNARETWQSLMRRGMRMDFSWTRSAIGYVALYESLARQRQRK